MGRVDEHRRRGAHPFQPAGAGDGGETRPDRVDVELSIRACAEERLDRGQRDHRVVRLMLAVQRQEDVGVHAAEALQFQQLPTDGYLPTQHRELGILARHRGVGANRLRQKHFHRLRHLPADDRDGVCRRRRLVLLLGDDAGLLAGDLRDGVAEIVGVVHADRRDHGDGRIDDIGGVPAPTEADFDDGHVDRGVGERGERHRRDHFELAHRRATSRFRLLVDKLHERFDLAVGRHVLRRADRPAVDRYALDGGLQVRAGGAAGATVERGQQCIDHPGHRRLAVGARDVDRRVAALRRAEQLHQRRDAGRARLQFRFRPTLVEQVLDL